MSRIVTSGIEQSLRTLEEFAGNVDPAADQLMEDYARRVFARSQVYVPVRDPQKTPPKNIPGGSLKQSGEVHRGDRVGEWIVGYGGHDMGTPRDPFYAVYVHEIMTFHHAPPTRAKYLELAVAETMPELIREAGATFVAMFYGVAATGATYVPMQQAGYNPTEATEFDVV